MEKDRQTAAWKELVERLPGVLGAEFTLENGAVREVHILSDQSRGAKQIVRDVQSAMLARFQVELDHRIVSVAQIPGKCAHRSDSRRLVCDRLELASGREGTCACVSLTLDGMSYTGRSACGLTAAGRVRAIALATVEALNLMLAPGCAFGLDDVRRVPMGERQSILVGLYLKQDGKTEALLGACYEGEDPNFSVVLATLDGVNRRFPTLPPSYEGGQQAS